MGTIEYVDGFDDYSTGQIGEQGWTENSSFILPNGRFGGQYVSLSAYASYFSRGLSSDAEYSVGFAFRMSATSRAQPNLVEFRDGTINYSLSYNGNGTFSIKNSSTILATSSNLGLAAGVWYHGEFNYKVHDSAGAYEFRFNGAAVIGPTTGVDTRSAGTGLISTLRLYLVTNPSDECAFDDIVITKGGGFHGDCRVITDFPIADGANSDFTPTSGVTTAAYQAASATFQSATAAAAVSWPVHQIDDIGLLVVESCGGEPVTLSAANGFEAIPNSPQSTGAGLLGTSLSVFWCRATSAAMANPSIADAGDHFNATILTFRGCRKVGSPFDATAGGVKAVASTSSTLPDVTTTVANALIVQVISSDLDSSAAFASAWTNANLSGVTEQLDTGGTQGNGGQLAVMTGTKAAAGAIGGTTATVTSSINAYMTMALKPNTTGHFDTVNDSAENGEQDYIASATPGNRDTFTFTNLGVTGVVKAVAIAHVSRKDDAGTRLVATVVRGGSTNYDNASTQSLAATYAGQQQIYETDPGNASAAWTVSNVNAREYGIKLDT